MLTALALVAMVQATSPHSRENPAISAFREACVEGSLKLSPERGRILTEKEITDYMGIYGFGQTPSHQTIIKINNSPTSYLALSEYKHVQSGSIASSCALVSKSITKEEAMAAFLEGLPDKDIHPTWIPAMYLPIWNSDHPELGYRKQMRIRYDQSIVLEVGLYPTISTPRIPGTKKQ